LDLAQEGDRREKASKREKEEKKKEHLERWSLYFKIYTICPISL
jgi:hypothetical protein